MVDGRLLQMDKKFSELKERQKTKIAEWFYEAYRKCFLESGKIPGKKEEAEIMSYVFDKVERLAKEPERMKDVEMAEPSMPGAVAEPEFQYGAEAFEVYQQSGKAEQVVVAEVKVQGIKGKIR